MRVNIDIAQIQKVVQMLLEEEQEVVQLTPDEYKNYLKFTNYDGKAVQRLKQFRNKKIYINGPLDLSHTSAKNITNIEVKGTVNLSHTDIDSKEGIVSTYVNYWDTPLYRKEDKLRRTKDLARQESLRDDDSWDLEYTSDKVAIYANVLYNYLIATEYEPKPENYKQRLEQLYAEKERREQIEKETEDDENLTELREIESEIEQIEGSIDLYNLRYEYKDYGLLVFGILFDDLTESKEKWMVGDEDSTERAAIESAENYIDDVGLRNINQSLVESHIDLDSLKDYFRESEEENVRENLEDFFDEDEFEYSDPQVQERIEEIEELLLRPDNLSQEEYDELNEELDDLKDSDKTISQDLIDDKVESLVDDLVYEPIITIENYDLDINYYVDINSLAKDIVEKDGYGHTLNRYDGSEDTIEFDGETYYIFQVEG